MPACGTTAAGVIPNRNSPYLYRSWAVITDDDITTHAMDNATMRALVIDLIPETLEVRFARLRRRFLSRAEVIGRQEPLTPYLHPCHGATSIRSCSVRGSGRRSLQSSAVDSRSTLRSAALIGPPSWDQSRRPAPGSRTGRFEH